MFAREKTHASSVPHPLPTLPNLQVGQQRNPSPLPSGRAQIIGRFAPVDVSNFLQARVWLQSSARSTAPGSMQAVSELSSKGWQTGSPMHASVWKIRQDVKHRPPPLMPTHRSPTAGQSWRRASHSPKSQTPTPLRSNEDQHNVVLVDGKCAHFVEGWGQDFWSGRLTAHQTNDLLSYCCIDAAHMKDCRWALRHFMFVPYGPDQAYLITFDSINKDGQVHTNWWQLQANPDYEFTIPGGRQAALHGDNARLDISFAIPTIESFPAAPPSMTLRQDVQDWGKPYGGDNAKAQHEGTGLVNTCLERPRLIAEVESNWIMAAISPRRKDEAPLPIRQIDECRVLRLEIDCGAFIDTILAAPDHGCIQLADVQALTELALIRRDPEGKLLATWTVDDAEIHTPDRGGEG